MIKFEALYYPMAIPPEKWLRSSFLFYDKIRTIYPKEDVPEIPNNIMKLVDKIPHILEPIIPGEEDIEIDSMNLDRIEKAFFEIAGRKTAKQRRRLQIYLRDGKIRIGGHTFLHNTKITKEVEGLLRRFKLIRKDLVWLKKSLLGKGFEIVDVNAGNLIMSLIADRIARKRGWIALTDKHVEHIVTSLNGFDVKATGEANSLLASSIIRCEIPEEILKMEIKEYAELRDSFSDIRELFQRTLVDLNNVYRLEKIESSEILEERIRDIVIKFDNGVLKYKESGFGSRFKKWAPFTIGNIITIFGMPIKGNVWKFAFISGSLAFQVIDKIWSSTQRLTLTEALQKQLAKLKRKILASKDIRRFI